MTVLYKFAPKFIEEGRLCWLRSPLFIVEQGKKRFYYFTDKEFNEAKQKNLIKGEVHRAKGLGALEVVEAKESMFSPEFQRLEILKPDENSFYLLENLMGENIQYRANYIFEKLDFSKVVE